MAENKVVNPLFRVPSVNSPQSCGASGSLPHSKATRTRSVSVDQGKSRKKHRFKDKDKEKEKEKKTQEVTIQNPLFRNKNIPESSSEKEKADDAEKTVQNPLFRPTVGSSTGSYSPVDAATSPRHSGSFKEKAHRLGFGKWKKNDDDKEKSRPRQNRHSPRDDEEVDYR